MCILKDWRIGVSGLVLAVAVGCGGGPVDAPPEEANAAAMANKSALKAQLEEIAKSGYVGSGASGMREGLEKIGDDSLMKDLDRLEQAKSPDQVKKIASEMAAKL